MQEQVFKLEGDWIYRKFNKDELQKEINFSKAVECLQDLERVIFHMPILNADDVTITRRRMLDMIEGVFGRSYLKSDSILEDIEGVLSRSSSTSDSISENIDADYWMGGY